MTDHTIPPRELVEQWASEKCYDERDWLYELHIANRAARYGADQELEACCAWLPKLPPWSGDDLRRHRRPKPPSLKEKALAILDDAHRGDLGEDEMATIRRALEQLDD
jgi:hypothetical protein